LVNFPVFETLKVDGYLLYPGNPPNSPGLNINLSPGPWLVIGVNGLGKSTLLLMLRHVLTGPVRARAAGFTGERSDLQQIDPRFFAYRVLDGAKTAKASITVKFGTSVLSVTRRLSDLALVEASLQAPDGVHPIATEGAYRELLAKAMNFASLDDALRTIDRVTFFLEAREPLIWDTAAQFELFRAILLPQHSGELRLLESTIVSSDSSARNLNATIFTLTKRRDTQMQRNVQAAGVRAQLAASTAKLEEAQAAELKFQRQLEAYDEQRSDARTETKRADRMAVEAASAYEQIKYEVLRHAFAGVPPNDQYVFLKIITDRVCTACGNPADDFANELEERRKQNQCLVCGQSRHQSETVVSTTTALQEKAEAAYATLMKVREEQEELKSKFAAAEATYLAADRDVDDCRQLVDTIQREVRLLRSKLPSADQAELAREEDRIVGLRHEVHRFRRERDEAEEKIGSLIGALSAATEAIREGLAGCGNSAVQTAFALIRC
jgi:energy-coupling factor transporter ATP-binding protein EcfA2